MSKREYAEKNGSGKLPTRNPSASTNFSHVPARFVQPTLTEELKQEIKRLMVDTSWYDGLLVRLTDAGYKVTLKYDTYSKAYAAWLIPGTEDPNAGMILTGRGSTPLKAMKQVLYAHAITPEGLWSYWGAAPRETDDD